MTKIKTATDSPKANAAGSGDQMTIDRLASQVLLYKRLYYSGQNSVPDAVYDALEDELRALSPSHPVLTTVGAEASSPTKLAASGSGVPHDPPMLSLEKTYKAADVAAFVQEAGEAVMTLKVDGNSLSAEYRDGQFVLASTRGTKGGGTMGEDQTPSLWHVPSVPKALDLSLLPAGSFQIEVRGELYFPLSRFGEFSDEFDSFRNAVSGLLARVDLDEPTVHALETLGFIAYDLIIKNPSGRLMPPDELSRVFGLSRYSEVLALLARLGFETPESRLLSWQRVESSSNGSLEGASESTGKDEGLGHGAGGDLEAGKVAALEKALADFFDIPRANVAFDGLVLRQNSLSAWHEKGATSHHPRGSLAFKRVGETAETTLLDIEVAVGRTGVISFRARLEPVALSGATVTYATLHNAANIEVDGYHVGCRVRLVRSGEVIPDIVGVARAVAGAEPFAVPKSCLCGFALERKGPNLYCRNAACTGRVQEGLVYFLKTMEVDGISDKIVEQLRQAGLISTQADFFRLRKADLLRLDGFKEKKAANVLAAIEAKRTVKLETFMASLGIPGVGRSKGRQIARVCGSLAAILALSEAEISGLEGWGEKTAAVFCRGMRERAELIAELTQLLTILPSTDAGKARPQDQKAAGVTGLSFCITGTLSRPRREIERDIEAAGGRTVSGVTAKTDYLVCNAASSSSKSRDAKKFGLPIISEAELTTLLGLG